MKGTSAQCRTLNLMFHIHRHSKQNLIMYLLSKFLVDIGKHWCVFIQEGLGPKDHIVNENHQIVKISDTGVGFSKEKKYLNCYIVS